MRAKLFFLGFLFLLLPVWAFAQISPFTEEATQRGLNYIMQNWPQVDGHLGFGVGFSDLDNDGDPDVIILGRADRVAGIFENDGTGNFIDRSATSGIPVLPEGVGVTAFDYNADGLEDLYFSRISLENVLVKNKGDFKFEVVTADAQVTDDGPTESASAADFNGDGWLDLYTCNYTGLTSVANGKNNLLYKNLGNGTFEDVGVAQGVDNNGYSFQSVWFDYDLDGDVDLYLSNDRPFFEPHKKNQLWRNDNGNLVAMPDEHGANVALYSMGVACGDFDGNGYPDLYCTNLEDYVDGYNPLLLNQGDGTFVEASEEADVGQYITSWGSIFFDYNNDTFQDLYVNNMFEDNTFYQCSGTFPCSEIAEVANVEANSGVSFSSAVADVDNDGDLDLLVNNLGGNVELFINKEGQKRQWIKYKIIGIGPNPKAIGANINTHAGFKWQLREILAGGNGYLGQNELTVHVGLGNSTKADQVIVKWPGGSPTRTLTNLPARNTWTIYPPDMLGDSNMDQVWDLVDHKLLKSCLSSGFSPGCELMDFDGSSVIDTDDVAEFFKKFNGALNDCDGNNIFDLQEITVDPTLDLNNDQVLDLCILATELLSTLQDIKKLLRKTKKIDSYSSTKKIKRMKNLKRRINNYLSNLIDYLAVKTNQIDYQSVHPKLKKKVKGALKFSNPRFSKRKKKALRLLNQYISALTP